MAQDDRVLGVAPLGQLVAQVWGWDPCDRPVCRSWRQPRLPEFSRKFRPIACGARRLPPSGRLLPLVLSGQNVLLSLHMQGTVNEVVTAGRVIPCAPLFYKRGEGFGATYRDDAFDGAHRTMIPVIDAARKMHAKLNALYTVVVGPTFHAENGFYTRIGRSPEHTMKRTSHFHTILFKIFLYHLRKLRHVFIRVAVVICTTN